MIVRILAFSFVFLFSRTYSQDPLGEMPLPKVLEDGFYKIEIPAEYSGYFTDNYSNLRISDGSKYEVPFITGQAIEEARSEFTPYEMLSKEQRKGCCTQLVFRAGGKINNIQLRIRNAEASKHASLLGSDDRENWFVLKERFHLSHVDGQNNTSELRIVDFPLSNYQYYQILIDDSVTAPLNIIEVGSYDHNPEKRNFAALSDPKIDVSESKSGSTLIKLHWDTLQRIDRLAIYTSGPPLFRRQADLYAVGNKKRHGKSSAKQWIGSAVLSNGEPVYIDVAGPLASKIEVNIDNHDSPPVQIDSIKGYQVKRFLFAHLLENKTYRIVVYGNKMRAPVYDLELFRNKIEGEMEIVQAGQFAGKITSDENEVFSSELMWGAILLIIAVLGFYSYRMVRNSEVS